MSYDIALCIDGVAVEVEQFAEGGMYALDGSTAAALNVTWNYGKSLSQVVISHNPLWRFQGIREELHDKRASAVIPVLQACVTQLGTQRDPDYWEPSDGNAGYAMSILLRWAQQYPDAMFDVS